MSNVNDAMSGGQEFKPLKFKLGKPGNIVKGTLTSLEYQTPQAGDPYWEGEVQVELCQFNDLQADEAGNYIAVEETTVVDAGKTIKVYGGRKETDTLFENSKVGDIIGIQFVEFKKGKGPKPFKVVLAKNFGKDPNYKTDVEQATDILGGEEVTATDSQPVEGSPF